MHEASSNLSSNQGSSLIEAHTAQQCVILTGPTASGKSGLAMAWAQALKKQDPSIACEIVSVDSALVYAGMNIGTAKPSAAEQATVPHHLIDLIAPHESYSVGDFLRDTAVAIAAIKARGALPVIVGGTMMYVNALLNGLSTLPVADVAIREQILDFAQTQGWPAVHAELALVDAVAAARIAPLDAQRLERALSVYRSTGKTLTAWQADNPPSAPVLPAGQYVHFSIEPARDALLARISQRTAQMWADGLVDEVRGLMQNARLHADLPSMRAVGYRQIWQGLLAGESDAAMQDAVNIATRQLAKRQMTWLRSMPNRIVLEN